MGSLFGGGGNYEYITSKIFSSSVVVVGLRFCFGTLPHLTPFFFSLIFIEKNRGSENNITGGGGPREV